MARYEQQRNFLKSDFKTFSAIETDKQKGIPQPPNVKAYDAGAEIVDLPAVDGGVVKKENIYEIIKERRSVRHYAKDALTIDESNLPKPLLRNVRSASALWAGRLRRRNVGWRWCWLWMYPVPLMRPRTVCSAAALLPR